MPISEGSTPLSLPGGENMAARGPRKPTTKLYPSITNKLVKAIKGAPKKHKGAFPADGKLAFQK